MIFQPLDIYLLTPLRILSISVTMAILNCKTIPPLNSHQHLQVLFSNHTNISENDGQEIEHERVDHEGLTARIKQQRGQLMLQAVKGLHSRRVSLGSRTKPIRMLLAGTRQDLFVRR